MEPSASESEPLRLAGFACTAVGALLIGVGAATTWATVTIGSVGGSQLPAGAPPGGLGSSLPPIPTKGTDTIEGKIALACALIILVSILLIRIARGRARPLFAILIIVAGITGA